MEIEASDVEWEKEDGGNDDLKDEIEEHGVNERLYCTCIAHASSHTVLIGIDY